MTRDLRSSASRARGPNHTGRLLGGRYRLGALVGLGGSGDVYAARDLRLRREVAVKVVHAEYAQGEEQRRRIRQEALLGAQITHPNLTPIHDLGEEIGERGELIPFIVMPLLRGQSARHLANDGAVPWTVATEWVRQLLAGLAELHAHGVIHRDVKLDNCMLVNEGGRQVLKLLDLGLAKVSSGELISRCPRSVAGQLVGTYRYMSPEQARGEELDGRADIYAAGVVLYELLTGEPPFSGTAYQVLSGHVDRPPPVPSAVAPQAAIPGEVDAVVLRALAKRPDERFASAGEFEGALVAALRRAGIAGVEEVGMRGCVEAKAALTAWWSFDGARARSLADRASRLDRVWSSLRLMFSLIPDE